MKAVLVPVSEAEVLHTRFGQMDYRPRLPEAPILNEFCSIGCVILCLFVCLSSDTLIHIYIYQRKNIVNGMYLHFCRVDCELKKNTHFFWIKILSSKKSTGMYFSKKKAMNGDGRCWQLQRRQDETGKNINQKKRGEKIKMQFIFITSIWV